MKTRKYEKGQALIFIVAAIIGLVAITGLTVDGGLTFADRQNAQNSADSAALGGALAKIRGQDVTTAALGIAKTNGYINNITHDTITVTNPITATTTGCDGQTISSEYRTAEYIHVKITTNVKAYFAPVVGIAQTHNCVEAIAYARSAAIVPLFDGNAIVGLNPSTSTCGIDTGNSNAKSWTLTGGGAFSNGCFSHPNGTLNVPSDKCITAVGSAMISGGGTHACVQSNQTAKKYAYPTDVLALMPPNPCTGAITGTAPNQVYAGGGKVAASGQTTFSNGVYCVSDMDYFTKKDIILNNATLYVTDTSFSIKFAGGGGFAGTATTTADSPYQGYYMIIAMAPSAESNPLTYDCDQDLDFRGNGSTAIVGTVFAPSACIDYRGNSTGGLNRSQVIGFDVTTNGNATVTVDYNQADNGRRSVTAVIELTK